MFYAIMCSGARERAAYTEKEAQWTRSRMDGSEGWFGWITSVTSLRKEAQPTHMLQPSLDTLPRCCGSYCDSMQVGCRLEVQARMHVRGRLRRPPPGLLRGPYAHRDCTVSRGPEVGKALGNIDRLEYAPLIHASQCEMLQR
jgi:hypothetical protein